MSDHDDFFVGWADKAPKADRRFFMFSGLLALGLTGGLSAALAARQNPAGPGDWNQGDILEWTGWATAEPYPMLRTIDHNGVEKTALLGCMNKCTPELMINQLASGPVKVRGSAIRRGEHLMIATQDDGSWIEAADADTPAMPWPADEPIGAIDLQGMILDTKCWFGAMRPNSGKVHKACASLCIRNGIPPAFFVRSRRDQKALMIMVDEQGRAMGPQILPFVADPLQVQGAVSRRGDLLMLKTSTDQFTRLA